MRFCSSSSFGWSRVRKVVGHRDEWKPISGLPEGVSHLYRHDIVVHSAMCLQSVEKVLFLEAPIPYLISNPMSAREIVCRHVQRHTCSSSHWRISTTCSWHRRYCRAHPPLIQTLHSGRVSNTTTTLPTIRKVLTTLQRQNRSRLGRPGRTLSVPGRPALVGRERRGDKRLPRCSRAAAWMVED